MASITKRKDRYVICVTHQMTWTPPKGMTPKQIEKELNKQAVLFEVAFLSAQTQITITFRDFATQWFHEYAPLRLKEKTIERYKQFQERVYDAIGDIPINRITARHIQSFIVRLNSIGANKKTGQQLSPKTIKNYVSFISVIFEYAIRMGMLSENPCKAVVLPSQKYIEHSCYSLEEAKTFLKCLSSAPTKYKAFFTLAIYGGLRRGELLGLEWKDIDLSTGTIQIVRTALHTTRKGYYTDTPKTKYSQRSLKLPKIVIDIIQEHKKKQEVQKTKAGEKWHENDRLFTTWNGLPMNCETPYNWLKKFCKRNGLRFVNVHSFRHLSASLLINSGVDVKTVSAYLGHSQTSTTLNIYAHTFEYANVKAMKAIVQALDMDDE